MADESASPASFANTTIARPLCGVRPSSTSNGTITPSPATSHEFTTSDISRLSFTSFPPEILAIVADNLSFEDLKSFRQVSRACAAPGAQSLFGGHCLSIFETPESLARLTGISTAPNLANAIRLVKVIDIWTIQSLNQDENQQLADDQADCVHFQGTEQLDVLERTLSAAFKRFTNIQDIAVGDLVSANSNPFKVAPTRGKNTVKSLLSILARFGEFYKLRVSRRS
jgi:hypothetical protein